MNCQELKHSVRGYFTRTLDPSGRQAVDDHASTCPDCAQFLRVCAEITCREVVEFLREYVEQELAPDRRAVFERHLALCGECRDYLDGYQRSIQAAKAAFDSRDLASMPSKLIQAVLQALKKA
jgi:anti-sigma factor RsiW